LAENTPKSDDDGFMNVQQAAKYIGKSAAQVSKMCQLLAAKNSLNVRNFGLGLTKSWGIRKVALDNWGLELQEIKSTKETVFKRRNANKKKQPTGTGKKG
jgi:hypothetical protein